MCQWIGAQGWPKVTKISEACPHCDVNSRKPLLKMKNVFSMLTRRLAESVEGLNSSLVLVAGNLWPKKGWPIAVVKGLTSFNFEGFGTHMKSIENKHTLSA